MTTTKSRAARKPKGERSKGGRPTDYDPAYCATAKEVLARGHSIAGLAGEIGVARSTVYLWEKEHAEFSDAIKAGQAAAILFWERRLIEQSETGEGNTTATIFGLKNRAADEWADRTVTENVGKGGGPIQYANMSEEEIDRRLAELRTKTGE